MTRQCSLIQLSIFQRVPVLFSTTPAGANWVNMITGAEKRPKGKKEKKATVSN
jgi:hypothetical protein